MSDSKIILKRSEQKKEHTWSTEDLYPTDTAWFEAFEGVRGKENILSSYQGRLAESGQVMLEYFNHLIAIDEVAERLYAYAMLKVDEDTRNSTYQAMKSQVMSWLVLYEQATSFETPELIAIPDETLESFLKEVPKLQVFRRYLEMKRRRRAHILSPAEEAILAAAGEMANAPDTIFSTFANADLTFPAVKDLEGNVYPLTNGSYISLMESTKPELRKNAFKSFLGTYDKFRNSAAAMLDAQVKQSIFYARTRKYASTMEAALDRTEVPVSVYHNLIEAVHQNMDKMYRYVSLRKKAMGLDEIHMYDLYAPIVAEAKMKITFEQAREDVLAATAVLGAEYSSVLSSSFDERWMDIYENEGKRSGAYSMGTRVHPYVLLNHKDSLDGAFTLAHEMGHAMHSYFSNKNQPYVYSNYVIFVAEVASICNESLLMQYMLKHTENKKQRAALINYFLEQFRTTLFRQAMFAEFEQMIHAKVEAGEALTADNMKEMYYDLNKLYYGNEIVVDKEIAIEWARIPHFYYNFYVYQYATGFAAAMALSARILKEGEPAVADYLRFLSGGCSQDPISLLKLAGVDMTTTEPVNQAMALFGELIDEMEELVMA